MRTGALALLLFLAACGGSGDGSNGAAAAGNVAAPGDQRETAATLTLAASGPGNCSARWEDRPATPAQVLELSSALIETAIQRAGGVAALTEANTPVVAVLAPAGLGFACADSYLVQVRRSGVPTVLLIVEGQPDEGALADFALSDIALPAPSVVLVTGAGGRLTWNGEPVGRDVIAERLRQLGGGGATEMDVPPGELELRPAREATFGQVHQTLRAVRANHIRAALLLPSVPPGPRAAPAPARSGPPPELDSPLNQAVPELDSPLNQAVPANQAAPAR